MTRLTLTILAVLALFATAVRGGTDDGLTEQSVQVKKPSLEQACESLLETMSSSDFMVQSGCSSCCRGPRGFTGPPGALAVAATQFQVLIAATSTSVGGVGPLTNGQLVIGSTGLAPVANEIDGTANQITVTNGAGSILLALANPLTTPGPLTVTGAISGATLTITGASVLQGTLTVTGAITANGGINGVIGATTPAAGTFTTLHVTGTSALDGLVTAGVGVTATTGNFLASTGNFVSTLGSASLGAVTNQIVLGTTQTTTLTAPAPAASRVLTIPDAGAASRAVLSTRGTDTQITSVTQAVPVAVAGTSGKIATFAGTIAAGACNSFDATGFGGQVTAATIPIVSVITYPFPASITGIPYAFVTQQSAGQFTIALCNVGTVPFVGSATIAYLLV